MSEWMWVQVDSCDDEAGLLFGRLDSEPLLGSALHVGDELAVSYKRPPTPQQSICRLTQRGQPRSRCRAVAAGKARRTVRQPAPFRQPNAAP